ncbi:MAG: flagellar hook-basal body complex protein [Planctomycetota bacterium]|nr:flagellar hook-basal body complex protein [Planctomycetota bacterium]
MPSTVALFTGMTGLTVNARRLEVIGNNISNVNSFAFKSTRMIFSPTFSRDFTLGTLPGDSTGGSNPGQVGLGVNLAGTQRNFNNGAISNTGINTDLAVEGDGFFIVSRNNEQFYTRAGAFQFNAENDLTTVTGERLQGYAVDENFNLVTGSLTNVNIPIGKLSIAEATQNVRFSGNLKANGDVATTGSVLELAATGIVDGTTLLTALGGGALVDTDVITITGALRDGKTLPDATFTVTAASTVSDLARFLRDALGIVHEGGYQVGDPTGAPEPGGFATAADLLTVTGNSGRSNDLTLLSTNITVADATGAAKTSPFTAAKTASAAGESVRTTFVVHDSLGSPVEVDMTMVLVARNDSGTFWRTYLHSAADSDQALHLETGARVEPPTGPVPLVQFDNFGRLVSPTNISMEIDRTGTGADDPLTVSIALATSGDTVTAFSDRSSAESQLAAVFEDGSRLGVLSSFSVGANGVITGGFSNGLTRTIGQLALATFTNPEGLVDSGNNLFRVGPNSGSAVVTNPLEFGAGRVLGGALELSNVDLSEEFINMILTSTGYSASSRVITTTDELLQQLLVIGR